MTDADLDFAAAWRGGEGLTSYYGPSQLGSPYVREMACLYGLSLDADGPRREVSPARAQARYRYQSRLQEAINAEWEATGPHYCQCGCGTVMAPPHYMAKGSKRFVRGHNGKRKLP